MLSEGHEEHIPHRAEYTWETRPSDICLKLGHKWSRWKKAKVEVPTKVELFFHDPFIITPETKYRICFRCKAIQDDAKRYASQIYPVISPFTNSLKRTLEGIAIAKDSTRGTK